MATALGSSGGALPLGAQLLIAASSGDILKCNAVVSSPGFDEKDLNAIDESGRSALMITCCRGVDERCVRFAGDTNTLDNSLAKCKEDIASCLLKAGCNVSSTDLFGRTALMEACRNNKLSLVHLIINASKDKFPRLDLEAEDEDGLRVLMIAAGKGHVAIVDLLLQQGVDVDAENIDGQTALMLAGSRNHRRVCEILLQAGAKVNHCDVEGRSVLMEAVRGGGSNSQHQEEVIRLLLQQPGIDLNLKDETLQSPLHLAVCSNNAVIARLLVAAGIDCSVGDVTGRTALLAACRNDNVDLVSFLLSQPGNSLQTKDYSCRTCLIEAVRRSNLQVISFLLAQPSLDLHAQDRYDKTALTYAEEEDDVQVIAWIKKTIDPAWVRLSY